MKYVHIEVWRYWGIEMLRRWAYLEVPPSARAEPACWESGGTALAGQIVLLKCRTELTGKIVG